MPIICPNCLSTQIETKDYAKKAAATVGFLGGTASGIASAKNGAEIGSIVGGSIGFIAGPIGSRVGKWIGALVGGMVGGPLQRFASVATEAVFATFRRRRCRRVRRERGPCGVRQAVDMAAQVRRDHTPTAHGAVAVKCSRLDHDHIDDGFLILQTVDTGLVE